MDFDRKIDRPRNKARVMSVCMKSDGFGSITVGRNLYRWLQRYSCELRRAVAILVHHSKRRIAIVDDGHMIDGAKMQIRQHVAGGKARDQKFFRIIARRVPAKAWIA